MRYKFRAKPLNSEYYVYGNLSYDVDGNPHIRYFNKNGVYVVESVEPDSIGEYLGFADKNGKDVFSGDKVKFVFSRCYDEEYQNIVGVVQRDYLGTYVLRAVNEEYPQAGHAYYLKDAYDLEARYKDKVCHVGAITVL